MDRTEGVGKELRPPVPGEPSRVVGAPASPPAHKHGKPIAEHYLYRATGYGIRFLEALAQSRIRVEGAANLVDAPTLFVCNHFTRFETFLVPYIIDKYTRCRQVHSLAHASLFRGRFGNYLHALGAQSTADPTVKHTMVEELLTGRHNWVIYPEGGMVKTKQIWEGGRYQVELPERRGPPHTGAAVMALQAAIHRRFYRRAVQRRNQATLKLYQERFHFSGPEELPERDLVVVPINITYYPLRPGQNLVSRLARFLFKTLPAGLSEELEIEGNLLFGDTDISIYFGKPVSLDPYLDPMLGIVSAVTPFAGEQRRMRLVLEMQKHRLTKRLMNEIYHHLTINFDHLFCTGLRALAKADCERIAATDFHAALYLAAREIQLGSSRRSHPSIGPRLLGLIADEAYPPLDSIAALCINEGVIRREGDFYQLDRKQIEDRHSFDNVRLKNTAAVIANELEPLQTALATISRLVQTRPATLPARVAAILEQEDLGEFVADHRAAEGLEGCKPADIGRPFLLHAPGAEIGIVLSHGYLAAPAEVRVLAEHLQRCGFSVYGVRLKGHGTEPRQLLDVTWQDWLRSFDRGYAALRHSCRHVIVGGFSTGGLLALLAAARKGAAVAGVFAVNAPLALEDMRSHLAPMVTQWNHLLDAFHIGKGKVEFVKNSPENPAINYLLNPVSALRQLELLMTVCRSELPQVRVPTLLIQGDHDPTVNPKSGQMILDLVRAEQRELALMAFKRHGIVDHDGSEVVLHRIAEFARGIAAGLRSGG